MSNPLVSVIMPVYNGEKYIEKSIGSIFEQSYDNIEFIAVNDGSGDNSSKLLEKIRQRTPKHVQMKIIEQENQGICRSRNHAIHEAKGEYLLFIDQDDFMRKECIENLYKTMTEENADMVIGGFDLTDKEDKILEKWELNPSYEWDKFKITAPWGRMFRKDIIDSNHIEFMVTKISEDFYFNLRYMSCCKKISVTSYRGYCWLFNEKSESHANMSQLAEDRNPLVMMTQLHKDMQVPNELSKEHLEYLMVKHIIWYLFFVAKSASREEIQRIYRECMSWLEKYYPQYKKNKLISLFRPKGERLKIRLIVKAAMVLNQMGLLVKGLQIYSKI